MSDYKIKITSQAIEHLKCIRDYIAIELSDSLAAKRLLEQIKSEMYSLQTMPRRVQCVSLCYNIGIFSGKTKSA